MEGKIADAENRARVSEEKLEKLQAVYDQMRNEHDNLLQQKAESDKKLLLLKKLRQEKENQTMRANNTDFSLK